MPRGIGVTVVIAEETASALQGQCQFEDWVWGLIVVCQRRLRLLVIQGETVLEPNLIRPKSIWRA